MRKRKIALFLIASISATFFACEPQHPLPVAGIGCQDLFQGQQQVGDTCIFQNFSTNATHYLWNFGDGTSSINSSHDIPHSFTLPGVYRTQLTAYDQEGNTNTTAVGGVVSPSSGNVCFWFSTTAIYAHTVVTIGTSSDTVKYTTGLPNACGQSGCANFQLPPGTYNYSAAELAPGTHTWSGSVVIVKHGCIKQQLL